MQGDELKAIRKNMGLTQADMGRALGISQTYIGLMERGEAPIEHRTEALARMIDNNLRHYRSLRRSIRMMEAGEMHTSASENGAPMRDTTAEELIWARERLKISEAGLKRLFGDNIPEPRQNERS